MRGVPLFSCMQTRNTLSLRMPLPAIHRFMPLFSFGVGIDAKAGMTLPSLLCDQLGIARDYIDQRVQTIFVNSRAVDRPDQVVLHSGDKIALSAAMPGLAGATLRREGLLAAFRQDITYKDGGPSSDQQQSIVVTLKLFNLVAEELSAHLLRIGVWINSHEIEQHFQSYDDAAFCALKEIAWNGDPMRPDQLRQLRWPHDPVFLKIAAA